VDTDYSVDTCNIYSAALLMYSANPQNDPLYHEMILQISSIKVC